MEESLQDKIDQLYDENKEFHDYVERLALSTNKTVTETLSLAIMGEFYEYYTKRI